VYYPPTKKKRCKLRVKLADGDHLLFIYEQMGFSVPIATAGNGFLKITLKFATFTANVGRH
jgi:hypothetical protein